MNRPSGFSPLKIKRPPSIPFYFNLPMCFLRLVLFLAYFSFSQAASYQSVIAYYGDPNVQSVKFSNQMLSNFQLSFPSVF
jgi:hypothetical protein